MPFEDGLLPVAPDYPTAVASSGPIALEDPEIPFVASVDRDDLDQQIDLSRYLFQPVELGPLERQDISTRPRVAQECLHGERKAT